MNKAFTVLLMFFLHIVDDYVLQKQGALADLKQKSYWEEKAPDKMYRCDYLCALLAHGFSWAFMIMLPIAIHMNFNVNASFVKLLLYEAALHALIDHAKANWKLFNLWVDQLFHVGQIESVAIIFLG